MINLGCKKISQLTIISIPPARPAMCKTNAARIKHRALLQCSNFLYDVFAGFEKCRKMRGSFPNLWCTGV